MIKKGILLLVAGLLILSAALVFNTVRYVPEGQAPSLGGEVREFDSKRLAENLAASVRFKTISHQDPAEFDRPEFLRFLTWLETTFPKVHETMERQMAGGLTPIYHWRGRDESLQPILLTGHYDVVPVLPGTEGEWNQDAFAGVISDGFIWGRGTLDDKIAVVGLMEAAERLIAEGVQPARSIFFVFGHDEEVSGKNGAARAVAQLEEQGIEFAWTLDEGSMVLDGLIPGIERPIASINVAEKGYLTLDLVARSEGGHSALPPAETAVGILAAALNRLQSNPVPGGLSGLSADFFDVIARDFPFLQRMLFANQWLFKPVLESELSKAATTNAMLRTTTAPTMLSGSTKENVLPIEAVGTVNFRLHPRDSVDGIIEYVGEIINDQRIEIAVRGTASAASSVSSHEGEAFEFLGSVFMQVFGDVIVVPGLTIAATDARHYSKISRDTYRILPIVFGPEDISRIHGTNERVSVEGYAQAVAFYSELMEQLQ